MVLIGGFLFLVFDFKFDMFSQNFEMKEGFSLLQGPNATAVKAKLTKCKR